MNRMFIVLEALLVALLLAWSPLAAAADQSAAAQARRQVEQPLNNAPVWREVRSGEPQFTTVRGVETGVLIQSGGETWREIRNGPLTLYGGILLCLAVAVLAAFYMWRGPIKLHGPPTGRMIQRFSFAERFVHWTMAVSFVILMLTGLAMLFGKHVLLPLFGYSLFSWVAAFSKNLHNFVGPLFILSVLVFIPMFVRDNLFRSYDIQWLKKFGGLASGEHVPSHRFNAGEKLMFWGVVVVLGIVLGVTGLILDFPNFQQGRGIMQQASIVHAVAAMIAIAIILGHIYLGTIGMEGALDSMKTGYVDEAWAKEHHEYWYNDEMARQPDTAGQPVAGRGTAVPQA
ncbi:MAG: formate dehydrogenase subunit gamma [Pseudomonadota bacterium]|jgi:formate dehydrogenase subunit gamma